MFRIARATVCAFFLLAIGCTSAIAQYNPFSFSPYKILGILRNRQPDLVMLAAHRGVHALRDNGQYTTTPENSLRAIQNAAQEGIEVVEIDVRLTQDGVPILTHDSTWGRETNVGDNWQKCCFDPFGDRAHPDLTVQDGDEGTLGGGVDIAGPQEQAGLNPNVSD